MKDLIERLIKIADVLDQSGNKEEAELADCIIRKISSNIINLQQEKEKREQAKTKQEEVDQEEDLFEEIISKKLKDLSKENKKVIVDLFSKHIANLDGIDVNTEELTTIIHELRDQQKKRDEAILNLIQEGKLDQIKDELFLSRTDLDKSIEDIQIVQRNILRYKEEIEEEIYEILKEEF
jgi:hypothetical protein